MSEAEEINKAGQQLYDRALRMSGQLGNWTMAANAGGLAFVLTTARDTGSEYALANTYSLFLVGLVCGFLGHIVYMFTLTIMWSDIARMLGRWEREQLEAAAASAIAPLATPNVAAEALELRKKLRVPLGVFGGGTVGTLLYCLAAFFAAAGLFSPLAIGVLKW